MIFVGIDWGTRFHDVCIINESGEKIKEFRIEICNKGFARLIEVLSEITQSGEFHIGIEDGNNLLADFLRAAGYTVYALNPKRVSRFKERYSTCAKKDDRFDAFNIALILLKDRESFAPISRSSDLCEEMKIHCETIDSFVRTRTKLMNQLWAELTIYFPAFLGYFSSLKSPVALRILKVIANPTVFQNKSDGEFLAMLEEVRGISEDRKLKLFAHLKDEVIHVKSPGMAARAIRSRFLADQISALSESIEALDEIVGKLYQQHSLATIFNSLPGAGERIVPRLLSLIGDDLSRFDSYQRLQCYAGTCPLTEQSGKSLYKVSMRRACNKSFRYTLHTFSFTSLRSEPWAREYYDSLKKRGKTHSVAIRALANKWAKIIFRMWKDNQPYDRERFLKNREIRPAA